MGGRLDIARLIYFGFGPKLLASNHIIPVGLMGAGDQAYGLPPAIWKLEYLKPLAPPPDAFQSRPGDVHGRHFPPFFPLTRRRSFSVKRHKKGVSPCLF